MKIKYAPFRDNEPEEEEEVEQPQPVVEEYNTGYASEGEAEVREILYNVEQQRTQNPEELVEEQIAEVLSSEAEVLKEHNIIGWVQCDGTFEKYLSLHSSSFQCQL